MKATARMVGMSHRTIWLRSIWGLPFLELCAIVLLVCLFESASMADARTPPRDEAMIDTFSDKRDDFENLVRLFEHDRSALPHRSIVGTFDDLTKAGIGRARVAEYKRLFARVRIRHWEYYPPTGVVLLNVWSVGMGPAGARKSFRFTPTDSSVHLVPSTDNYHPTDDEYPTEIDRQIAPHWYIHFDAT